jgi:hypothetical protein
VRLLAKMCAVLSAGGLAHLLLPRIRRDTRRTFFVGPRPPDANAARKNPVDGASRQSGLPPETLRAIRTESKRQGIRLKPDDVDSRRRQSPADRDASVRRSSEPEAASPTTRAATGAEALVRAAAGSGGGEAGRRRRAAAAAAGEPDRGAAEARRRALPAPPGRHDRGAEGPPDGPRARAAGEGGGGAEERRGGPRPAPASMGVRHRRLGWGSIRRGAGRSGSFRGPSPARSRERVAAEPRVGPVSREGAAAHPQAPPARPSAAAAGPNLARFSREPSVGAEPQVSTSSRGDPGATEAAGPRSEAIGGKPRPSDIVRLATGTATAEGPGAAGRVSYAVARAGELTS